jgi:hypothetical protein
MISIVRSPASKVSPKLSHSRRRLGRSNEEVMRATAGEVVSNVACGHAASALRTLPLWSESLWETKTHRTSCGSTRRPDHPGGGVFPALEVAGQVSRGARAEASVLTHRCWHRGRSVSELNVEAHPVDEVDEDMIVGWYGSPMTDTMRRPPSVASRCVTARSASGDDDWG